MSLSLPNFGRRLPVLPSIRERRGAVEIKISNWVVIAGFLVIGLVVLIVKLVHTGVNPDLVADIADLFLSRLSP